MFLTDLCLIKKLDGARPLVCYGEVKTISGDYNEDVAIDGHNSLMLGEPKDALSHPEILRFISTILYETARFEEAHFISGILLGNIKYDKRHDLFIVHSKEKWADEILDHLECHPLDERLVDFSTKVVLISQLRQLIDTVYDRCTQVTNALIKFMDKQEYLQNAYLTVESLMRDRQFRNDLAQVQARSIQEELSSVQPDIQYTFKPEEVWRRCDYVFSNSSLFLREESQLLADTDKRTTIMNSLKTVAQSFEFLSKIANEEDQEILLINAAICYHIAGFHANAQCLAKSVEKKYLSEEGTQQSFSNFNTHLTWLFRQALISFLRRDIRKLKNVTEQAIDLVRTLQEQIVSDLETEQIILNIHDLYGHLFFQKALHHFTQYCSQGAFEQFTAAQKNIEKCHFYFQQNADTRLDIIASELRTALKLFEGQSTWSNIERYGDNLLQSPIWSTYLRNLAFEKSIVEFWASQLKALQGELLTSDDSFVIQMPTKSVLDNANWALPHIKCACLLENADSTGRGGKEDI